MGSESAKVERLLDLINIVDNVPYEYDFSTLYKLLLPDDPRPHGFMLSSTVSTMHWTPDFTINHENRTVQLNDHSNGEKTSEVCNTAFQRTIDAAIEADNFSLLHGEHSEMYRLMGSNCFVQLERFAAPLFGIASRGAHLTAYVRTPAGLKIWVPRRSANLFTYPNKLDTTVAGGVKAEDTPFECILDEADEESSLPKSFVKEHAIPIGIVSYMTRNNKSGLINGCVLFNFDIELPADMIPKPHDGEVSEFYLMSVEEITEAMLRQEFKPNCCLVMMDFFIRHGIMTSENEKDYVEINTRLRRSLPIPT